MTNNTQRANASTLLAEAADEYARAAVDTARNTDVALAAIAFRAPGSDAALSEAFALAAAAYGEERVADRWSATEAVPTWDEYLRLAAKRAPYAISPKTVGNLRNATRFLLAAGIPVGDAVPFADAKRLVSKGADAALKVAPTLKGEADPAAALAALAGGRGAKDADADARKESRAAAAKEARANDPYGFAALLAKVEGDADRAQALADAARALAEMADRVAAAARGGLAVVDVVTGEALAA